MKEIIYASLFLLFFSCTSKNKCTCYETEFKIELENGPYGLKGTKRWVRTSGSYTDYCANHEDNRTKLEKKLDELNGPRPGTTKTICE
jgi:hypothetical protein